jgi:gliding motility-associated-like protein
VSPDAWANIQQGMNAAGAAGTSAATGMSLLMKGVIAGGIVAATVTGIYLFSDTAKQEVVVDTNLVVNDQTDNITNNISVDQPIQDENLPENTVDGLNVSDENNVVQLNDLNASTDNVNQGPEYNGGFVEDSNGEGDDTSSKDEVGDEVVDNGNQNSTDGIPQSDVTNVDPIKPDVTVQNQITSDVKFEGGSEFAPTTYMFHANAENARSVEWLFEDGTVKSGEDVEFTFDKPGKYNVIMTAYGDAEPVSESIEVVIKSSSSIDTLPNIVTPNGDRINDFFAIATTDIEIFEIIIINSQGAKVYETTDVNFKWNCTNLSGEKLPAGDYYYTFFAKGKDGTIHKKTGNKLTIK